MLAVGELHAINLHNQNLDFGPWQLGCDRTDFDTANRLKAGFRAAARYAAMAVGAPYRVNLLDWWISKLARGRPMGSIQGLIQRSVEYCEELETTTLELGLAPTRPAGAGGLYRDRYPCDWGDFYVLYGGPPRSFSDPKIEFEYWTEQIWSGFNEEIARLDQIHGPRERQGQETRQELKDRIGRRLASLYRSMERLLRGLSYDLAVLQANYFIDCGLRGNAAMRAYQDQSVGVIESVRVFGNESSKRLGLSYRRQEKDGVDPARPFEEVGEDLRHLMLAMPAEEPIGIPGHAVADSSEPAQSSVPVSTPENAPRRVLKNGKRLGRLPNQKRRDAIRTAIRAVGDQWRNHLDDIFIELDSQKVPLGDFATLKINLDDGQRAPVSSWADLGLAEGKQRRRIVDVLRKYTD
jgi:hypothetical protein